MMIHHKINIDLTRQGIPPKIHVVQGDTFTRKLSIRLFADRRPWPVPKDAQVLIRYQKPDRSSGAYDTLADGTSAIAVRNNQLTILVAPEALTMPGQVSLVVSFLQGDLRLSTFALELWVQANATTSLPDETQAWIASFLPSPEGAKEGQQLLVKTVDEQGHVVALETADRPKEKRSAYELAQDAGFKGSEADFARHLVKDTASIDVVAVPGQSIRVTTVDSNGKPTGWEAMDLPTKLSELENDLYFSPTLQTVLTLHKTDLVYMADLEAWVYFGSKLGLPTSCEQVGYAIVFASGETEIHLSHEDHPLSYTEGSFISDTLIIADGVTEDLSFGGEYLFLATPLDLSQVDTFSVTIFRSGGGKTIPADCLPIAPSLDIYSNGHHSGSYNGQEAVRIDLRNPSYTGELINNSGYITALQAPVQSVNGQKGAVLLEALPCPEKLTINGVEYDGSQPVEITITGSSQNSGTDTILSDNLFDKSTAITGKMFYHSSAGPSVIDSTEETTGMVGFIAYVPLRGAGTYRTVIWWAMHGDYATRVPILKEDHSFLQNLTGTLTKIDSTFGYLEFTVTEDILAAGGALYAFHGMVNEADYSLSKVMIVKDRTYPSAYIPYGYVEAPTSSGNIYDKQDNILRGKTALFLGDSLCAGTTTLPDDAAYSWGWGGILGEANQMVWKNYGRNGGTITPLATVEQVRWIPYQAELAMAEYPDADYVILEGGTNDADTLGLDGLGEFSSTGYTPTEETDFTGAFETLVLNLIQAFPHAKLGYIVAPKMGAVADHGSENNLRRKFFDRAVAICKKWGIPVLDLWENNPMNPSLSVYYDSALTAEEANTAGKCYTDGQHLTLAGYQRITPQIEAFLRSL